MDVLDLGPRLPTLLAEFQCPDAPAEGLTVRRLSLTEALDGDYEARLTLVSEVEPEAKSLLGADSALTLARGSTSTRCLFGIIGQVEYLGEVDHLYFVNVRVVPAFTLLGLGQSTRIWQDTSVRDIITAVLDPALAAYGREFDVGSTTRGARVRDYCVQFRESDRDFVCRLLEEEGLAYDFVHDKDAETELLTLRDSNEQFPKYESLDGSNGVPFIDHDSELADLESIQALEHARELTVTGVFRRDYDWRAPRSWLDETNGGSDHRKRERRVYLHQDRRFIHDDLTERSADVREGASLLAETLNGRSNVSAFMPGLRFELTDASSDLDGEYVIMEVTHDLRDTHEDGGTYGNSFRCLPKTVPHRPMIRTPKPRVHGPHTATVVGDDEIHTDEYGRIQVQFHWEEQPSHAAGASCWIRCAQSWSGLGWGAQFIPRRGMEVVVEFLEGSPDRPIVTGCVYNGDNDFPFAAPSNKTQSGWRTRSTPNSEGYNMLRFEDAAGEEEIHMHAQKDCSIIIENDKAQEVRHDETLHVYNDRKKTVSNNERETIARSRWINVGLTHTEMIGVNMALTVGVNQVDTVGVNKNVTVGQVMNTAVGKDMNTVVAENFTEGVGDTRAATVGVDSTVDVGKNYTLSVGEELTLQCGDASIVMKKDGTITVRGKAIDSETSENTDIRGKLIKLNC